MKILIAHPSFYFYGGAEYAIVKFVNYLTAKKHVVDVITTSVNPDVRKDLKCNNIIIIDSMQEMSDKINSIYLEYNVINFYNHPVELMLNDIYPSVWFCLPENTLIYADNHMVHIEDIKNMDNLMCGQQVKNTYVRDYDGILKNVKVRYILPVRTTPEHPIKICKFKRISNKWNKLITEWKEIKDITIDKYERTCVIIPKLKKEIPYYVNLNNYSKIAEKQFEGELTKEISELMGWYFAEGYANEGHVDFTLNINEKDYANRILEIAKIMNISGKIVKMPENNTLVVKINSTSLGRFLKEKIGNNAKEKVVPDFMFIERREIIESFIDAVQKGDGDINERQKKNKVNVMKRIGISTELGVRGLQILLMKIGVMAGLSKRKQMQSKINGRVISSTGYEYSLYWSINANYKKYFEDEDNYYLPIDKITEEKYNGKVYNLETTDNFYCVPFIVHNCNEPPDAVLDGNKVSDDEKKYVATNITKVVVADKFNAKRFKEVYGLDAKIIPYGVDYGFFSAGKADRWLWKNDGNFTILHSAWIHPRKNQLKSLEVVNKLKEKISNVKIILCGQIDIQYAMVLAKYIKDNQLEDNVMIYNGFMDREKLRDLYKSVDVLLHPIGGQGGALTPFEAMCAGLPVVISKEAGCSKEIKTNELGYVTDDYISIILSIYNQDNFVTEMSNNAIEYVKTKKSWDKYCRDLLKILVEATK